MQEGGPSLRRAGLLSRAKISGHCGRNYFWGPARPDRDGRRERAGYPEHPFYQRLVSAERWEAIEKEIARDASLTYATRVVPWVAHGVPRETLDRLFADVATPFKVIWRFTRRGFARREERTFRYA